MDLPESVLTKGRGGKIEVRAVESRGNYVICKYLDPKTLKTADDKRKLMLKNENGEVLEYFIIPLKDAKRALLLTTQSEEKERELWNETLGRAEGIW